MELDRLGVEMCEDDGFAGTSGAIGVEGNISGRAVVDDRRSSLLGGLGAGKLNEVIVCSGTVYELRVAIVDRRAVAELTEHRTRQDDLVDTDLKVGDVVHVT